MDMLYELFQLVGEGNGDHGTRYKRVAWSYSRREAAELADRTRAKLRSDTFIMFCGPNNGPGRPIWNYPPLNA